MPSIEVLNVAAAATLALLSVGTLYVLHHVRPRPKHRAAATLLFWRSPAAAQQSRVLRSQRFAHRKTFLLSAATLLLLAATLWTVCRSHPDDRRDAMVIDAGEATGAHTAAGRTVLSELTAMARTDLNSVPAGVIVVAAGPQPLRITASDEPAIAAAALKTLEPQAGASASSLALLTTDAILAGHGAIHWYTTESRVPDDLPPAVRERVLLHRVRPPEEAAIVGVTYDPPASGERGVLRVRVAGADRPGAVVHVHSPGHAESSRTVPRGMPTVETQFDDIPAEGQTVTITLDRVAAGSVTGVVDVRLPDLRPITFEFGAGVPDALKEALRAIGREAEHGDVYVGAQSATRPASARATIDIVEGPDFDLSGKRLDLSDASVTRGLDLEGATATIGPVLPVGGEPLITAGGHVVAALRSDPPTLLLSRALIGDAATLPNHAAFPVLLGRVSEILAGRRAVAVAVPASRRAEDPLWAGPADASAALVTGVADRPQTSAAVIVPAVAWGPRWAWSGAGVLLGGVLALLGVDAALRATRKIV